MVLPQRRTIVVISGAILAIALVAFLINKMSGPDDYLGCLEANMREAKTEAAARAISSACSRKYGYQLRESSVTQDISRYLGEKISGSDTTEYHFRPGNVSKPTAENPFADFEEYVPKGE